MESIAWVEPGLSGNTLGAKDVAKIDRCASRIALEEIDHSLREGPVAYEVRNGTADLAARCLRPHPIHCTSESGSCTLQPVATSGDRWLSGRRSALEPYRRLPVPSLGARNWH
jgi:hypothetical protein